MEELPTLRVITLFQEKIPTLRVMEKLPTLEFITFLWEELPTLRVFTLFHEQSNS